MVEWEGRGREGREEGEAMREREMRKGEETNPCLRQSKRLSVTRIQSSVPCSSCQCSNPHGWWLYSEVSNMSYPCVSQENMFKFGVEKEIYALKPMNCPGHW